MSRAIRSAAAGTAVLTAVTLIATSAPGAQARPATPSDLAPLRTLTSLTATHHWFQQEFKGLPVLDGYYVEHVAKDGATTVDDGRVAVPSSLAVAPKVTAAKAGSAATTSLTTRAARLTAAVERGPKQGAALPTSVRSSTLAVQGGSSPALVWSVVGTSAEGVTRTTVDATTGAVRSVKVLTKAANGKAKVFRPNPVVTLENEDLKDKGDAPQKKVLAPAYVTVTLNGLAKDGTLSGPWAEVVEANVDLVKEADHVYDYTRDDDRFEQVNAYAAVDGVQRYVRSLGFTDANAEAQKLSINTFTGDNSFYDPSVDVITLGTGGVDDAEDMEVVWHEYGHALQDAVVPGFGESDEAGAMGEGFGDYFALTMSAPYSDGFDLPCIMDWDATAYTDSAPHCLRRTDTGKTTDDMVGEVHDDGEIWSAALYRIHQSLGRKRADTVVLEGTYAYAPDTTFAAAAQDTVDAAQELYGARVAGKVRQAFVEGKILQAP